MAPLWKTLFLHSHITTGLTTPVTSIDVGDANNVGAQITEPTLIIPIPIQLASTHVILYSAFRGIQDALCCNASNGGVLFEYGNLTLKC